MKIITVKSRTLFLLVVALLLLVFLLPSCTVQKRLYRPGFYVERHSDNLKTETGRETVAETETEREAAAETETEREAAAETETEREVVAETEIETEREALAETESVLQTQEAAQTETNPVLKRIAAAPKLLHKRIVKKQTWSNAKITEDQGYTLAIIGGIVLLVILVIIGYSIGDPLFVLKAIVIGWYILQILAALAVLGLIIYGIWWLFDFMDGGCGF